MVRGRLSARAYRRITVVALAMLAVIVVTGALVRLTGSGLGCVDWPACNEERFVDVSSTHGAIEQINRLFTGVVAVSVILAVLGSLIRVQRSRDLTRLSLGLVLGVLAQVVIGGIVVLTGLHPLWNMAHFLVSMILVSMGMMLVIRAGEPDDRPRREATSPTTRRWCQGIAIAATVAIVTGTVVTATGPHAGDEDAPRLGFGLGSVARIHGISVVITLVMTVLLVARLRRGPVAEWRVLRTPLETFLGLGLLQGTVGYVQYFSGVPVGLVALHIALATAIMISVVHLVASTRPAERLGTDHPTEDPNDVRMDRASATVS
jgi:cytochrome c oxidase assembly protein subunit 15